MKLYIVGGNENHISAEHYSVLPNSIGVCVSSTTETVEYAKQELQNREHHRLSAAELKHNFSPESNGHRPHNCIYIIADADKKELLRMDGAAKGYRGEGPRGALTLDSYFDLLGIPVYRRILSTEMIQKWNGEKEIEMPRPRRAIVTLEHLVRVQKRARDVGLRLWDKDSFYRLSNETTVRELLDSIDFENRGQWT